MRFFALLVPVVALSLGSVACSGEDPQQDPPSDDVQQQSQLAGEGDACSVEDKCKPGLVCVARVKGGDVGIKGVPCGGDGCFGTSSSSSSSSSGSTSSSSSSGSTSGWSSSSSSSGSTSGWSSSSSSSGSTSGWSSSSSSSGSAPEVGICMHVR